MNDELLQTYTFRLLKKHIKFLDTINADNQSLALRTILDSIINGDEQLKKKRILDTSIMWACFGAIFLFISYLMTDVAVQYTCIMIGVFLFAYGTIGGALYALRRTNYRR